MFYRCDFPFILDVDDAVDVEAMKIRRGERENEKGDENIGDTG